MKRKTVLLILLPTFVVISLGLVLGAHYARKLPTGRDVEGLKRIDDSMALGDRIERYEPLVGVWSFVATVAMLFAVAVLLYHFSTFPRVRLWRERVFLAEEKPGREAAFAAAALGAGIVLTFLVLVWANGVRNLSPEGDEISYLEEAIRVRRDFGVGGFLEALYKGQWGERNRHPLYIWLLSVIASPRPEFFVHARLLSTFLAAVSVVVAFFFVRRLFGGTAGVLMLFLYGLTRSFVEISSKIWCEALLVSLVTVSVYYTVTGFERNRRLWVAGAMAGLAYMTKLSGLFLPMAFLVTALFVWRLKAFRNRHFYGYFAAFLVAASPLIVRNVVRFGNPFSNYNFSLLWLDGRLETDTAGYSQAQPGAVSYFEEHSATEVASRFTEGSERLFNTAAKSTSPFRFLRYRTDRRTMYPLRLWGGLFVMGVAAFFLLLDPDWRRRAFVAVLAGVVFVPMAWYAPLTSLDRFVVPFLPIMLGYFAKGLISAVPKWQYRAAVLSFVPLAALWSVAGRLNVVHPLRMDQPPQEAAVLAEWLSENLEPGDRFVVGPDDDLEFGWFLASRLRGGNVPQTRDVPSLVAEARRRGARYIVVSRNLLKYVDRTIQMSGLVRFEGPDMVQDAAVNGLRQVFEDPVDAVDFIVFEVVEQEADDAAQGGPQ